MKNLFLILAIVGAIGPWIYFADHISQFGWGLGKFIEDAFANPSASGIGVDLSISSTVLWVWMFCENRVKHKWAFVLTNLFVGLSCALPAYLYFRESSAKSA